MNPIELAGFNAAWQMNRLRRLVIVKRAAKLGEIVAGVECKWLTSASLQRVFPKTDWHLIHNDSSDATAGCLLALRRDRITAVKNVRWHVGTTAQMRGFPKADMLTRWIIEADVQIDGDRWITVFVAHFPPKRYFWLYARMLRQLRRLMSRANHSPFVFADWNRVAAAVAAGTGLLVRQREVLAWAVPPGTNVSRARPVRIGGDHPAVVITLRTEE